MTEPVVFVIDDEVASREVIAELVRSMHLPVREYPSAEAFREAYKGERPACIVSDQRMPGMSGIDLVEWLRERELTIPVVMVTAFPDTQSTVRAVRGGAMSLLEKPFSKEMLWKEILEAIQLDQENAVQDAEREEAREKVSSLAEAEQLVAQLLLDGHPNKVVASRLDVSLRTVESRRASIFKKLGVSSIAGMVQTWLLAKSRF
ncbi:MAG TPA: DNA-binding response regulator [Planctomycetaceae bacterium]|nr:DNA-binding response regulator [Planctomycetaceae bacterium]